MVFAYSHAHAATPAVLCGGQSGYQHCFHFSKSWTFKSGLTYQGACCVQVTYSLPGNIGYDTHTDLLGNTTWTHLTLLDPVLTASVRVRTVGCLQVPALSKLSMTQYS